MFNPVCYVAHNKNCMNMNGIQIFRKDEFGEVRVAGTSEEPLFCLADICRIMDIRNVSDCKSRLDQKGIVLTDTPTNGGLQPLIYINEKNLYKVIMRSDKPQAEPFQDWVCSEVLPSIRKTGTYSVQPSLPKTYLEALKELVTVVEENERLSLENKEMKPKAEFFDEVAESKDAISIGDLAKVLAVKGMGRNNLFEFLRNNKVLMENNVPYQKYVDCNYFRVIEQKYMRHGEPCIGIKTLVYQRGVDYVRKLLKTKKTAWPQLARQSRNKARILRA